MSRIAANSITEQLLAKARELSELLEQTEELNEYVRLETEMLNNPEVIELRQVYERRENAYNMARMTFQDTPEDKWLVSQAKKKWESHPAVQAYRAAQDRLQALLDTLNAIITFPITGDEQPAAKGGCGSGGCSGGG